MDRPVSVTKATDDALLGDLIARCALADQHAFQLLYENTGAQLFGMLLRLLKSTDLAEDALQDTYLRVWNRAATYRPDKGSPWAWLVSIARYRALDMLRSDRRSPVDYEDASALVEDRPEAATAMLSAESRTLHRCLDQLKLNQKHSLVMSYCEGYSHGELSKKLNVPIGTVKSWVRRGLKALRECLEA